MRYAILVLTAVLLLGEAACTNNPGSFGAQAPTGTGYSSGSGGMGGGGMGGGSGGGGSGGGGGGSGGGY